MNQRTATRRPHRPSTLAALAVAALAAGCASSGTAWRIDTGLEAESIELQVDADGTIVEIEYHVLPDAVPQAIHDAMARLHPGGVPTGAEKEWIGDTLYWELTTSDGAYDAEAMFTEDGRLHSSEVEVPATAVRAVVRESVLASEWGLARIWEEIRDGEEKLVEYHVKTSTADGRDYKLAVSPKGAITGVWREIEAEVELPVR